MLNGSAKSNSVTLGILLEFNSDWMGGVNYIVNFIKTLNTLPVSEIPTLVIILDPQVETNYQDFLKELVYVRIEYLYTPSKWILNVPLLSKVIKGVTRIVHLTSIVRKHRINALFPVMCFWDLYVPTKSIGWIPDFQHINFPDYFSKREIKKRNISMNRLARRSPFIIFSSVNARQDFEKFFPNFKSQNFIYSFQTVLEKDFLIKDLAYIREKYQLEERFFYLPNQFWIHKNHLTVFKALKLLLQQGLEVSLVCTGSKSDYRNKEYFNQLKDFIRVNKLNKIKILGLVPREDQFLLYYYAHAIIQPSLSEGWSSIVEDAKAFQKMIILSDIPVHREQNPSNAIYFNPIDYENLANKVNNVWGTSFREKPTYQELFENQEALIREKANSLTKFLLDLKK